jgi:hypothetical protein
MSLSLRLLAACRQAYAIAGDGPVAPVAGVGPVPASNGVGWTVAPQGVTAGLCGQDAGFVGAIAEGVVVAIRGTTPSPAGDPGRFLIDWADDATACLATETGAPGRVHLGFWRAFDRLWVKLQPLVHAAVQAHPSPRIFVTGHSKGGAISPLIAWRLARYCPNHQITVRAFAPARVGDDAFARTYNARIPDHIRFEFDADVVPHLPADPDLAAALGAPAILGRLLEAADLGYGAVGALAYIQADGAITGESDGLEQLRLARLLQRLAAPDGLAYVAACHSLDDPGAGYVRAAYPA